MTLQVHLFYADLYDYSLHKEICDFYEFVKPQNFEQIVREELVSRLQDAVSDRFPHGSVHCFGSYAAGLYLPTADMDVVVVSNSYRSAGQKVICQSNSQMYKFGEFLEVSRFAAPGSVEVITGAKVPIIKFVDKITAIRIDVSFENDTGIIANDTVRLIHAVVFIDFLMMLLIHTTVLTRSL